MNFFSDVVKRARTGVEDLINDVDPNTAKWKQESLDMIISAQAVSVFGCGVSGVLGTLGVCYALAGSTAAAPLLFAAVPLAYVSYNAYRALENGKEVVNLVNTKYSDMNGDPKVDEVKKQLKKDTILFDWAIDFFASLYFNK